MCRTLQIMWNKSDKSDKLCERIIKAGLHADILNNLRWETLSAAVLNGGQSSWKRYFVKAHTGVLHNVLMRIESAAREPFRQCQAVDVVQKFRDVTEYPVIFNLFSRL